MLAEIFRNARFGDARKPLPEIAIEDGYVVRRGHQLAWIRGKICSGEGNQETLIKLGQQRNVVT